MTSPPFNESGCFEAAVVGSALRSFRDRANEQCNPAEGHKSPPLTSTYRCCFATRNENNRSEASQNAALRRMCCLPLSPKREA